MQFPFPFPNAEMGWGGGGGGGQKFTKFACCCFGCCRNGVPQGLNITALERRIYFEYISTIVWSQ